MFKEFGILLLCVQLITGLINVEELKKKCINDEEFKNDVKTCFIKDNVAMFEVINRSMTFRCISITIEKQSSASSNLTISLTPGFDVSYVSMRV